MCLLEPRLQSGDARYFEPAGAFRPKLNWFGTEKVVFIWIGTLVGSPRKRDSVSGRVLFLTTIRRLECDSDVSRQARVESSSGKERSVGRSDSSRQQKTHRPITCSRRTPDG